MRASINVLVFGTYPGTIRFQNTARSFGGIVLVPPGQHTAFQLDGVLETLRLKQADRGYTAVCTQANGDDRLLCIELQKRKTVLQRMDRYTHSTGYMTAPPFSPAAYIDNLYWVVPGETGMEFGCADVGNATDGQPPETLFQSIQHTFITN